MSYKRYLHPQQRKSAPSKCAAACAGVLDGHVTKLGFFATTMVSFSQVASVIGVDVTLFPSALLLVLVIKINVASMVSGQFATSKENLDTCCCMYIV